MLEASIYILLLILLAPIVFMLGIVLCVGFITGIAWLHTRFSK